jgi:hypothetical protein
VPYFSLPAPDPTERALPAAEQLQRISDQVFGPGVDSHTRLEALILLIYYRSPEVFWAALTDTWDMCDDTWGYTRALLRLMRAQKARPYIPPLSWPVRIFRGCSRPRVRGVSWTMDRKVAEEVCSGASLHTGARSSCGRGSC